MGVTKPLELRCDIVQAPARHHGFLGHVPSWGATAYNPNGGLYATPWRND